MITNYLILEFSIIKKNIPREEIKQIVEEYLTKGRKDYELELPMTGVDMNVYKIFFLGEIFWLRIPSSIDTNYEVEVKIHKDLTKMGAHVPEVIAYEEKNKILNVPIMILRDIGGEPLFENNMIGLESAVIDAGRDLALINSLEVKNYGYVDNMNKNKILHGSPTFKSFKEFCLGNFYFHLQNITKWGVLTTEQSEKIRDIFMKESENLLYSDRPYLIHGDYKPEHIFIKNSQYVGVIDFSDIQGGSNLWDLAHVRAFSEEYYQLLKKGYNDFNSSIIISDERIFFYGLVQWVHKLNFVGWNNYEKAKKHLGVKYCKKCIEYFS